MHIKTIVPMLVYATLGATPAEGSSSSRRLALTAIVRRPRGALVTADLHQGTIASCEQKQVGLTRTNHSLVRSGFTNSRKSGSPQRDNTASRTVSRRCKTDSKSVPRDTKGSRISTSTRPQRGNHWSLRRIDREPRKTPG